MNQATNNPRPRNFLETLWRWSGSDISTWILLASNIWVLILYLKDGSDLGTILIIYWIQSVIIGFFNFFRILGLKEFSTEGFLVNGRAVKPTRKTKIQVAWFFAFHYGFFHLIYAIFLISVFIAPENARTISLSLILGSAAIFFANHLFSFFYNRNRDTGEENIGQIMFLPYARILPMHLMIIFGVFLKGTIGLIIFISMKTIADLTMHIFEHKKLKLPGNPEKARNLLQ
jgi:uncharacterized protein DUF6498